MVLEIREHDVQVSIDDYGTGFSSLAYLRDLPVQELKMDRSFVGTILTDARSRVIVSSTKQMAHAMGLRMVAEGVENAETAAELEQMGVDVLQGDPPRAADGRRGDRPVGAAVVSGARVHPGRQRSA